MKVKKSVSVLLAFVLVLCFVLPASASTITDPDLIEIPGEVNYAAEAARLQSEVVDPDLTETPLAPGVLPGDVVEPRSVSVSKNISLPMAGSWSKSFTMATSSDLHDAFSVIVSNVSGTYKVMITSTSGYAQSSSEYSNSGVKLTKTNALSTVTYTVTVLNTGTDTLTANVKISSYYNS